MKTNILGILLAALGILQFAGLTTSGAEKDLLSVAVLDFVCGEDEGSSGKEASNLLTGLLSSEEGIILVERADLETLLGETELSLSGAVSTDDAVALGRMTGAKVLITGRLFASGKQDYVVAKVISTETSRVFGANVKYVQSEGFASGVELLREKVAEILKAQRANLVADVESAEERISRLRKLVDKKNKLPLVFVEIPEEHLSRTVPDPAAETEILKTLQDVGFPLTSSIEEADIVVHGEAFSEAAGRRANLISCRARVEIKISSKNDKADLRVDRQTSMAIDLSENIAAKSALQNAGSMLAERLVPILVR